MKDSAGIDAEKLAALLDGRLAEKDRAEVLARLAESDELREVYADAVATMGAAAPEHGRVLPLERPAWAPTGWRRPGVAWLAIAAVLAVVVLGPVMRATLGSRPPDEPGRYAALLGGPTVGLPKGWDAAPWVGVRGAEEPLTPAARAARIGVRMVDLDVAITAKDTAAGRIGEELAVLLEGVPAGAPAAAMYRVTVEQVGEPLDDLRPQLKRASAAAAALAGAEMVTLGAWAEAARIAAARRDAEFFRSPRSREAVEWALSLDSLPAPVRRQLAGLQPGLEQSPPNWDLLQAQLTRLVETLSS